MADIWITAGFAAGASLPLLVGAIAGVFWRPPRGLIAAALAFAAGALISAVAFDLFEEGYSSGGAWIAAIGFASGAVLFVVADTWLDRRSASNPTGWALLAAVTLDGIPENSALGVSLNGGGSWPCWSPSWSATSPRRWSGRRACERCAAHRWTAERAPFLMRDGAGWLAR
ncbi:MAG: hypothetical protein H0U28_13145 [Nocardioidaceae bacterium]|nr:hypothetical protein [Nocardioidaceae bacterium]